MLGGRTQQFPFRPYQPVHIVRSGLGDGLAHLWADHDRIDGPLRRDQARTPDHANLAVRMTGCSMTDGIIKC